MSRRSHAYLDLAAEPAIGSALLDPAPVLLYAPDARRILFANAAGCEFMGEAEMARLLDRPLSAALPATETIARFARSVPLGAGRLERIRFQSGGRLESLPARCTRVMLPDGESGVLVTLAPPRGAVPPVDVARRLTAMLAATDCLVAVLDAEGGRLAEAGTFEGNAAETGSGGLLNPAVAAATTSTGASMSRTPLTSNRIRHVPAMLCIPPTFRANQYCENWYVVGLLNGNGPSEYSSVPSGRM